ncbi:MAG: transposase [Saprospiraceae bacterium]|nr:transposase [Saprospiraceae bacterium]
MLNDRLSAMRLCGLEIEDDVPDHSTLSQFHKELTEKKAYERIRRKLNIQLKKRGLIIKGRVKVDASLTDSPWCLKGKVE